MIHYIIFIIELTIIYYAARYIQGAVFSTLLHTSRSKRVSAYIVALIYLPGTFIHEVSHYLVGFVLGTRPKGVNLIPRVTKTDDDRIYLRFGSVEFDHSGVIKSTFVGFAPFFAGMGVLYFILQSDFLIYNEIVTNVIVYYLLFSVSSQMFLSESDIKSSIVPLILLAALILLLRSDQFYEYATIFIQNVNEVLIYVVGVYVVLILVLLFLRRLR